MTNRTRLALRILGSGVMMFLVIVGLSHYFASFWDAVMNDAWWVRLTFSGAITGTGIYLGIAVADYLAPPSEEELKEYLNRRRDW